MQFNAKRFDFSFFLPRRAKVVSLEKGATQYGGATKVKDEIYSNYGENDFIQVDEKVNELSVFVPSTYHYNIPIDNAQYVEETLSIMDKRFRNIEVIADCKGSFYDEDTKDIIYEDITIIKAYVEKVTANDIMFMQEIAKKLKDDMVQKGVTITINDSLAIV